MNREAIVNTRLLTTLICSLLKRFLCLSITTSSRTKGIVSIPKLEATMHNVFHMSDHHNYLLSRIEIK
ncbi:hypothetical protein O9G_004854 [Rozella allomycis CSF55]|uniref:Uncharacterized protein n=1 Tax=Rozella allomycis (strain CSF55) TaxID=988480 RepID=A0A075B248_ROZAC|nr:hypothetical protein O9G_004854 [Rozella allomycis CSF55]|eukprot:EPZ36635.1 hypothetical protein O9G_004854 [Rozella allomycis CSF55]